MFKKTLLTTIGALPLVAASLFAAAGEATAAALKGSFQIAPSFQLGPSGTTSTNIAVTEDTVNFTPDGAQNILIVDKKTGSFTDFSAASISDITSIAAATVSSSSGFFMDLGTFDFPFDNGSTTDGLNTFTLTKGFDFVIDDSMNGMASVIFNFQGFFTSATGETTKGMGNLTFQVTDADKEDVEAALASGDESALGQMSFSGAAFTSVPEASTTLALIGLGLAGVATTNRKRKQVN